MRACSKTCGRRQRLSLAGLRAVRQSNPALTRSACSAWRTALFDPDGCQSTVNVCASNTHSVSAQNPYLACQGAPENFCSPVQRFIKRPGTQACQPRRNEWNKAGRASRSITETTAKREAGIRPGRFGPLLLPQTITVGAGLVPARSLCIKRGQGQALPLQLSRVC
jgi:hypothetical protein